MISNGEKNKLKMQKAKCKMQKAKALKLLIVRGGNVHPINSENSDR